MKEFMGRDFLLTTRWAEKLYHTYAEHMPILDYHCHISAKEIAEDKKFETITQIWLGGDHYKWRQMRSNGIEEAYITGDMPDFEKFRAWAGTLEKAIGNPLYHWSHLELRRYFCFTGHLKEENAKAVWELCNQKLRQDEMSARGLIRASHVTLLCTTDDPADSMIWHKKIAEDKSFPVKVLPTFRPDRALQIGKPDYLDYLEQLGTASGVKVNSYQALLSALHGRMDAFAAAGCVISDHGLESVMYRPAMEQEIEAIFAKRLSGSIPKQTEILQFQTAVLLALGREYHARGWAMQLHYGCRRDNNQTAYRRLGPDSGFDCIGGGAPLQELADFLNALHETGQLPRTILYSLNPNDNAVVGTLIGCFQDASAVGKIQQGSAWWFNDHKKVMEEQLTSLANLGLLGNFIGMLTDSRSFLSYARHEYFRRVLCNLIGGWVERGEYPADEKALQAIVCGICYDNAVRYFGFEGIGR